VTWKGARAWLTARARAVLDKLAEQWILAAVLGLISLATAWWWVGAVLNLLATPYRVPGWLLLVLLGLALFGSGAWLRVKLRERGAPPGVPRRTLIIVPEGTPYALVWSPGGQDAKRAAHVTGDFRITNRSKVRMLVARSMLEVRRHTWLSRPQRVDGMGMDETIKARSMSTDRFMWVVEPPLPNGRVLVARACLVDNFGNEHWTPWLTWKPLG
jgi:hypothetical protein